MRTLKCKQCGEDVEVPENRRSAVCLDCADKQWQQEGEKQFIEDFARYWRERNVDKLLELRWPQRTPR